MSDQFVHDQLMHDKGYRYRLTPIGNAFEPLYTKTLGPNRSPHAGLQRHPL
jgi:hypothetical protein